jgi:CheY-like chemotaxis protein
MERILVVEDSSLVRSIVGIALRRYQRCQVAYAGNGVEALAALERGAAPDLVLLDINMPKMNGLELLAELRELGVLPRLPVIIMSTEGADDDVRRGLDGGAVAYLRKPFRQDQLWEMIDTVMSR